MSKRKIEIRDEYPDKLKKLIEINEAQPEQRTKEWY